MERSDELRSSILAAIERYVNLLNDPRSTEADIEKADDALDAASPNSFLADMLSWGEKTRTHEEIADEAAQREEIWSTRGEFALLLHVREQLSSEWNPPKNPMQAHYADEMIKYIDDRLTNMKTNTQ